MSEEDIQSGTSLKHENDHAPNNASLLPSDDVEEYHTDIPSVVPETEEAPPPMRGKVKKKKKDGNTLRKAPQSPKRFKSSYILFFMAKQQEIKDELGRTATVCQISKRSAEKWKTLPAEEKAHWDEMAAEDKRRFMAEKAMYTGVYCQADQLTVPRSFQYYFLRAIHG